MPAYPQPRARARTDGRGRLRILSAFTQYFFIISALFSLAACTAATTNTSEFIAERSGNTPKAVTAPTTIVISADPAEVPAVSLTPPPAEPREAPATAAAAPARLPVIESMSPAAGLQDPAAEGGGVINLSVCAQGLRGTLVTAQAGGSFLSANGADPSLDDETSMTAAVRPAMPLVDLAPSAGANEAGPPLTSLRLQANLTQSLLAAAYEQTGRPYVLGGQSPDTGFDATGYVRWVYGQKGIHLPKEAQRQVGAGRQVGKDDLRPGDLLVYRDPDNQGEAYHVGIYTGQGNFLHATAKTGVVNETAAFGPQYAPYFMGGRRYFDDPQAGPLSDAQKTAAASSAVKLALSELGPDDKLVRPTITKPRAAAKSRSRGRSGGKSKKK